jgi:N-methylhydantoinase B
MLILAGSGGAGSARSDGWLTMGDSGTAGMPRRDSVEIDELQFPIVVETQRIIPDTEGAGRYRGTPGTLVEFGPVDCDIDAQYASDGVLHGPLGVRGGLPGATADQWMRAADGSTRALPPTGTVRVNDGEIVVSVCTGGGGYGSPLERDLDRVAEDLREGWITEARARDVYGLALDERGAVDRAASDELRSTRA